MNEIVNVNGYKIIYIISEKKITSVHAYINTGSMFENEQQCGISHLLEHIITDSWERCKGNCTSYWSKKGVISNAQTLTLYTRYFILGMSKEIDDMINYIASTITNPKIDSKCIKRSKQAIKDEILIRLNNPEWKLYNSFYESMQDNTDFHGIQRIGNYPLHIKNLKTITQKNLIDYYNKWYRPDNIFFVVVSNKPLSIVKSYFTKYLHKKSVTEFNKIEPYIICTRPTYIFNRKDAEKNSFLVGFINNNQHPSDYLYYNLIQDMLTGDLSSFLYLTLRDKMNLIYGIKLIFEINKSYVLSIFEVSCQFENAKKLINTLIKLLKQFVAGKYQSQLLNRSKERISIIDMNNCHDNTEFLNVFYANQFIMSNKIDIIPDDYIKIISKITKEKLSKIVKRLFKFDQMLIACETKI